ncbi:MAG: hypothetical protein JSV50_13950 [Desulfobacteraceae bacterium]|nr:MAG: hypothetical protein JSV50_13950 [Desulfobacteraceae bacterium]
MRLSIRKLFLLLAIVFSFTAVKAVWAHVESIEGPYTVSGTVAYVWSDRLAIACGYTMDPDSVTGCPLIVWGMGPAGWWSVNEVTFPAKGAEVTISIYRVTSSVGNIKYVAGEVIDNGEGESILLRIPVYDGEVIYVLDPAWSKMEPLAEATILSTTVTGDADCTCKCKCKGEDCSCDCVCDDCIPVGDEHKWRGEK